MTWLQSLAGGMPWWAKITGKVILSRLPVSGRVWQKLGLFSPGLMHRPDYAISVFDAHYHAVGAPPPGFTYLELGPGDSLASAVVGQAYGAARGWLVDSGSYATRDMALYRDIVSRLEATRPGTDLGALKAAGSLDEILAQSHVTFLEEGLDSLRQVPDESCDFIFSEVVLEHVPRGDFTAVMAELYRILKRGGSASHDVDFRDHLGGGWNILRFSQRLWEAPWFAQRSGFYTNRLRLSEIVTLATRAGFSVTVGQRESWPAPPLPRARLDAAFRDLDDDDLLTQSVRIKFVRPL